jgi:hypothetical protein
MKDETKGRPNREKTDTDIDEFINTIKKASETFNAIAMLASRTSSPLSDDECVMFENLCKKFGVRWRQIQTMSSRPLKLHLLESHLWKQMWMLRTIAFAEEGGVERLHAWWNVLDKMYSPMRNWTIKTTAICKRFAMETFGPVKDLVTRMHQATQRRWTVDEAGKRQLKREREVQMKAEVLEKAAASDDD